MGNSAGGTRAYEFAPAKTPKWARLDQRSQRLIPGLRKLASYREVTRSQSHCHSHTLRSLCRSLGLANLQIREAVAGAKMSETVKSAIPYADVSLDTVYTNCVGSSTWLSPSRYPEFGPPDGNFESLRTSPEFECPPGVKDLRFRAGVRVQIDLLR